MQFEGRNAVIELLRAHKSLDKIVLEDQINKDDKVSEILKRARKAQVRIEYVKRHKLDVLSPNGYHQGVIAYGKIDYEKLESIIQNHRFGDDAKKPLKLIYIREAQLEGNVGAVARSAESASFHALLMPPKMEITSQMLRSSAGALANLPVVRDSLFNVIKFCHKNAIKVIGVEVAGTENYFDADLSGDILLIVGGEDKSLSEEVMEKCDTVVKIPTSGRINSLNMSVASAVVMFEKVRQDLNLAQKLK